MRIHFLGPAGTFSEQAAKLVARAEFTSDQPVEFVQHKTISEVASAIKEDIDIGVLPFYNLLDGAVTDTVDALISGVLFATGCVRLGIRFDAACKGGIADIRSVASHPKALAQCKGFIRELRGGIDEQPVESTAASVVLAETDRSILAIASPEAIESSSLVRVGEDVGDQRYGITNYTEFLAVRTHARSMLDQSILTDFLLKLPLLNSTSLATIIGRAEPLGLTLEKLLARPAPVSGSPSSATPQTLILQFATKAGSMGEVRAQVDEVLCGEWEHTACIGLLEEIDTGPIAKEHQ